VDLATLSTWHLRSTDRPTVVVSGPFQILSATPPVRSYWLAALGVKREIDPGAGPPGTVANIDLSTERLLGPRFDLSESILGPADSDQCSWFPPVVLDDVNPLFTVFGGGALVIALLAALAVLGSIRVRSRWKLRFALGVIAAVGVIAGWSALEQFGIVPWRDHGPGLYLVPVGFLAGFVLVGLCARSHSSMVGGAT
jgi:hypothetical protein